MEIKAAIQSSILSLRWVVLAALERTLQPMEAVVAEEVADSTHRELLRKVIRVVRLDLEIAAALVAPEAEAAAAAELVLQVLMLLLILAVQVAMERHTGTLRTGMQKIMRAGAAAVHGRAPRQRLALLAEVMAVGPMMEHIKYMLQRLEQPIRAAAAAASVMMEAQMLTKVRRVGAVL